MIRQEASIEGNGAEGAATATPFLDERAIGRLWIVRRDELADTPQTPGLVRQKAYTDGHVWIGRIHNDPYQMSDWHVHPGRDTFGYVVSGRFRLEFGDGGEEACEAEPGDFVIIPAGVVHREGNPYAEPSEGVLCRVGEGPLVVNLEGPTREVR